MTRRTLVLGLCAVALLGGCATGARFQKVEMMPAGKAIIYIYRPSAFGAAIAYDVRHGQNVVTTMKARGYYPYITDPGEVELSAYTESNAAVTLDVRAGEVYYVKASMSMGVLVGHPRLTVVSAAEAEKEIANCKLIVVDAEVKK